MNEELWNINTTVIHPLGAFVFITCAFLIIALKKDWVFVPIFIILCFVSNAQRLNIAGLDFTFSRLIILTAWFRIFIKGEHKGFKFSTPDLILLMWLFARGFIYSLQWADRSAVIYQVGEAFSTCGFYFMGRVFIRNIDDVKQFGRQLALVAVPLSVFFAIEWLTGRNYFSVFGGVRFITWIRDGRLRCGGAFSHPLVAGYFWGVAIFFMTTLYDKKGWHRKIAVTGTGCGLLIVASTASSTPVLGVMAGLFGWCFYYIRSKILHIVVALVATIFTLHLYMRAPVWHLISRISVVGGSTGDHRYRLIDAFLTNVSDWFFMGYRNTDHWGRGLGDVTNEFILQAIRGGFVSLVLFSSLVFYIMFLLQKRMRAAKDNFGERFVTWNMWVILFMQCAIFFSLSVFGQAAVLFHLSLGITASLALSPVGGEEDKTIMNKVSAPVKKEKKPQKRRETGGWIMPGDGDEISGGWI